RASEVHSVPKTHCGLRSWQRVDNSPTWKTRVRKRDRIRPEDVVNVRFSIKSCAFPQQSADFSAYLKSRFVRNPDKKTEKSCSCRQIAPSKSRRWYRLSHLTP